jgi:SAM-dependent methyltransferase
MISKSQQHSTNTDMNNNAKSPDEIYRRVLDSDLMRVFTTHHNSSVDPFYVDRGDRNRFAAGQIKRTAAKRILNLGGGGRRHLAASLSDSSMDVYEIDMQGDCDLQVNIDRLSKLPFDDNFFDAACAFDVLEHLENFHLLNEEMYRVAKDYVLISLPNSAAEIFYDPFRNRPQTTADFNRGVYSIFYGLPLYPPDDRHRWWMYFQDIIRYYFHFSLRHNASLEFWTPQLNLKKTLFTSLFGSHLYYTYFCPFVWVKLSKPQ